MLFRFCSTFHTLSTVNFENRLTFDKVTESLKVGTFLRHSVVPSRFPAEYLLLYAKNYEKVSSSILQKLQQLKY